MQKYGKVADIPKPTPLSCRWYGRPGMGVLGQQLEQPQTGIVHVMSGG
jgi:hypothetical protein